MDAAQPRAAPAPESGDFPVCDLTLCFIFIQTNLQALQLPLVLIDRLTLLRLQMLESRRESTLCELESLKTAYETISIKCSQMEAKGLAAKVVVLVLDEL